MSVAGEKSMFDISSFKTIFWDFDGVIKDSIEVKTRAYVQLFNAYGTQVSERVREHHETNGGMSRFDKFPIYLAWVGIMPTVTIVNQYSEQFSQAVLQGVIDSPWVPGVERVLRRKCLDQTHILVSATPQDELKWILEDLQIIDCFSEINGAPTKKSEAIAKRIALKKINPKTCLMIGDAIADMEAAEDNKVPFLLRKHKSNKDLFATYSGPYINDFSNI
jgi:phosphoglycolate phosphatase-like HAD superfamily hydrolase